RRSGCECAPVRHWRVRSGCRRDRTDADRDRPPIGAQSPGTARPRAWTAGSIAAGAGGAVMEIVLSIGIGTLAGCGVWLILRPRTFQVIIGLSLLSYAVNLFILSTGRLGTGRPP